MSDRLYLPRLICRVLKKVIKHLHRPRRVIRHAAHAAISKPAIVTWVCIAITGALIPTNSPSLPLSPQAAATSGNALPESLWSPELATGNSIPIIGLPVLPPELPIAPETPIAPPQQPTPIPEPCSSFWWLLGTALVALFIGRRSANG